MACIPTLYGNTLDCSPSVGGIREIYVIPANWNGSLNDTPAGQLAALSLAQGIALGLDPEKLTFPLFTEKYVDSDHKEVLGFNVVDENEFEVVDGHETPVGVKYEFPKGTAHLESTATVDPSTGVEVYENVLTISADNLNQRRRRELADLLHGEWVIVAKDNMGNDVLLGCPLGPSPSQTSPVRFFLKTTPMKAKSLETASGSNLGDANRGTIALSCFSNLLPPCSQSEDFSFLLQQNQ